MTVSIQSRSVRKGLILIVPALILSLLIALPALAKVPITLWLCCQPPQVNDWAEKFQADFNMTHPDIDLHFELVGWKDVREKVLVSSASGVGPDISYFPSNLLPIWINAGMTLPLDPYLEKMPNREDFLPDILNALTDAKGQVHSLPFGMWPIFDLYNLDVFEKYGVALPNDWQSQIAAVRKLTKYNDDGSVDVYGYRAQWNWESAVYGLHMRMEQLGKGLLYIGDEQVDMNNERGRQGLRFMQDLWTAGNPDNKAIGTSTGYDMIFKGKIGIMSNVSFSILNEDIGNAQLEPRRVVGPNPGEDVVRHNAGTFYILRTSKHPDEAWQVLSTFLQPKNLEGYYRAQGSWLPVRKSMFQRVDQIFPHPLAPKMVRLFRAPILTYGARHRFWAKVHHPGGDILLQALQGKIGITGALEEAERLMNSILSEQIANEKTGN